MEVYNRAAKWDIKVQEVTSSDGAHLWASNSSGHFVIRDQKRHSYRELSLYIGVSISYIA